MSRGEWSGHPQDESCERPEHQYKLRTRPKAAGNHAGHRELGLVKQGTVATFASKCHRTIDGTSTTAQFGAVHIKTASSPDRPGELSRWE